MKYWKHFFNAKNALKNAKSDMQRTSIHDALGYHVSSVISVIIPYPNV